MRGDGYGGWCTRVVYPCRCTSPCTRVQYTPAMYPTCRTRAAPTALQRLSATKLELAFSGLTVYRSLLRITYEHHRRASSSRAQARVLPHHSSPPLLQGRPRNNIDVPLPAGTGGRSVRPNGGRGLSACITGRLCRPAGGQALRMTYMCRCRQALAEGAGARTAPAAQRLLTGDHRESALRNALGLIRESSLSLGRRPEASRASYRAAKYLAASSDALRPPCSRIPKGIRSATLDDAKAQ